MESPPSLPPPPTLPLPPKKGALACSKTAAADSLPSSCCCCCSIFLPSWLSLLMPLEPLLSVLPLSLPTLLLLLMLLLLLPPPLSLMSLLLLTPRGTGSRNGSWKGSCSWNSLSSWMSGRSLCVLPLLACFFRFHVGRCIMQTGRESLVSNEALRQQLNNNRRLIVAPRGASPRVCDSGVSNHT